MTMTMNRGTKMAVLSVVSATLALDKTCHLDPCRGIRSTDCYLFQLLEYRFREVKLSFKSHKADLKLLDVRLKCKFK